METLIKIDFVEVPAMDPKIGIYTQYCVTANDFIIATFVDPLSRKSYSDYLKKVGLNNFPKEIKEIIAFQADVLQMRKNEQKNKEG